MTGIITKDLIINSNHKADILHYLCQNKPQKTEHTKQSD